MSPKSGVGRTGFKCQALAFDFQLSALRLLFRVRVGGGSGELVETHVAAGWGSGFEQGFDAAHGFGCEQDVTAKVADLCGNVVDHHHLAPVFDGVDDRPGLIGSGTSRNGALFRLRRLGLEREKSGACSHVPALKGRTIILVS